MLRRAETRHAVAWGWSSWVWPVVGAVLLHLAVLRGALSVDDRLLRPVADERAATVLPMSLVAPVPTQPPLHPVPSVNSGPQVSNLPSPRLPSSATAPAPHAPSPQVAPLVADALPLAEGQAREALRPSAQDAWEGDAADPARVPEWRAVPSYPAELPAPFVQPLKVHRAGVDRPSSVPGQQPHAEGEGVLRFERDGVGAYALHLNLLLGARPLLEMHSQGGLGAWGLEPERLTDRRRGRSRSAANLDRAAHVARFSGGAAETPLAEAAQDRLSWLLQLPAVVRADPSLQRPGAQLWLQVVGARGGSQIWRFDALGQEALVRPDGTQITGAWRWRRQAELPYDLQVDVWLSDSDAALPALVRLTPQPGGAALSFWPAPTP